MCGIIGYSGHRPAIPLVVEGLRRLEYRGYDSAGVASVQLGKFEIVRAKGKLSSLEEELNRRRPSHATTGMGHTRWATHGEPAVCNAHPHESNDGALAVVHNGIIENYLEIKADLEAKGYSFTSETDTEVLVNLVQECRKEEPDLLKAFAMALRMAKGAYAVCLMSRDAPNEFLAARMSAPLVIGIGAGEFFAASDIPAFLPYTRKVLFLEDGELAKVDCRSYQIYAVKDLSPVSHDVQTIDWDVQSAQKGGYRHFMLKEIFEQPRVIADCLAGRVKKDSGRVSLPELDAMPVPERLHVVACGTSWHAGLWGRCLIERWADIPVQVEIASEFRYRERHLFGPRDMALVISQSGETADTLAALRIAKEKGVPVIALCNVVGSSAAREADAAVFTHAGPEISVASTKAMCSQMIMLVLFALYWSGRKGIADGDFSSAGVVNGLLALPKTLEEALPAMQEKARELSGKYSGYRNFFYLGRGHCYPLALEGALKLKELSYIHAEGYASGEMKHGPIALVDRSFPTFAIALDDDLLPKVKSNMVEIRARQGRVIALANEGCGDLGASDVWIVPDAGKPLSAFVVLPALQLFSYEVSDSLGKDVDQPRNLAKSVTVE